MSPIEKSSKLENVCYDIRGPVLKEAKRLEEEGNKVLKLNIGNPAPFGFEALTRSSSTSSAICLPPVVTAIRKDCTRRVKLSCSITSRGMRDVTVEDIYIGNGVSELIVQAMQALLNSGDEMLVPARTTRCGRRRCRFPAAKRCTICVTNPLTGSRIWTTSAQNHTAHPRDRDH